MLTKVDGHRVATDLAIKVLAQLLHRWPCPLGVEGSLTNPSTPGGQVHTNILMKLWRLPR
jgi:hypothetical protein